VQEKERNSWGNMRAFISGVKRGEGLEGRGRFLEVKGGLV
jgi:hypothetical protein